MIPVAVISMLPLIAAQIAIAPGESIQAAVGKNPAGATFLIKPGVHRLQSVQPKAGDTFVGEPGAMLSGAQELSGFQREGRWWVASIRVERVESKGECGPDSPGCTLPEDLFIDNVPRHRQTAIDELARGGWYLDYAAGKAYLAEDPQGHRVEMSVARYAFAGDASNVTIRGLTIEKYAGPTGVGAVHGGLPVPGGKRSQNWVVEDNEIRWNHDVGIWVGQGMRVLKNRLHHNGHMGVGGTGRNVIVDGNEIAYNNYAGYDYHWAAGGAKFVLSEDLQLRNNYVHHNEGPGLWADIDCDNVVFEHNRTSDNKVAGIFFEISFGAIIRDNVIQNEGGNPGRSGMDQGAGILLNTSSNAEIYRNEVVNCPNGIVGIQSNRGTSRWTSRTYALKNMYAHDNSITQESGFAAGIRSGPAYAPAVFTEWNNRFENNTYKLRDATGRFFFWDNGPRTTAEWKTAGNEHTGKFIAR
jgi:hypothetical protein